MRIAVIKPAKPIVTPEKLPGAHATDDALVTAMIAAAQAEIDGPGGWLGRSLGEQTIELRADHWPSSLPFRPIIAVESVTVDGVPVEGVTAQWDGLLDVPAFGARPSREIVIVYRAGYDGTSEDFGKTGQPPANAVAAVILMTQDMIVQSHSDGGRRSVTVDDIITESFNSLEMVQRARSVTVDRLLAPLRIYAL